MEVTAHRTRAVVDADEAQRIVAALMDGTVRDTRGFSTAGLRVAQFLDQHAAGGTYAPLYPVPVKDTYGQRLPDPFLLIGSSRVCDMWQLDYGDVIHGHITLTRALAPPMMCVTPLRSHQSRLIGATSRRPVDMYRNVAVRDNDDDTLADYLVAGDNTGVLLWALAFSDDIARACEVETLRGPELQDRSWQALGFQAPGRDIALDVAAPSRVLEATYLLTPRGSGGATTEVKGRT